MLGIRDCLFTDNAAENGGAVAFHNVHGGVVLQNVTAINNTAMAGRGGLLFSNKPQSAGHMIVLRGVTAHKNSARWGGVVFMDDGLLLMSGLLAFNNTASFGGVLLCNNCDVVATQLDSARAVPCSTDGLPPLSAASV